MTEDVRVETAGGCASWRKALLTGLAFAAGPVLGLNLLLVLHLLTNAQREVDSVAAEVAAIAELRLDTAVTALVGLGLQATFDCGDASKARLQTAALKTGGAIELAVLDSAGAGACSAFGAPRVVRRTSPEHGTLNANVHISTAAFGESGQQQLIRLLWSDTGAPRLHMLLPGDRIFPYFLKSRLAAPFVAQLAMIDGAVIVRQFMDPSLIDASPARLPSVRASATSRRYPIQVDIEAPGAAIAAANANLFLYGNLCGLALSIIAVALTMLTMRRSGGPVREIADGIRRGEFVPYYQPVFDITNGQLVGCEVLVRWRRRDGTVLSPGRFITLAEASGEIFPMTISLMEAARDDLARSYGVRPQLKVGFNLFAGHFEDLAIVEQVRSIFETSPVRMTQLMFEVTERQPLHDIPRARVIIAKLQELGVRVALDDVGTGHGGLSYLLKLGVDVMKMDKMFVDAIGTDRYSVAIIDSMVKLADDLQLELIAEGVETFEQLQYLRQKGVRMAQGYVFAPPLPASAYLRLVEAMCPAENKPEAAALPRSYSSALRA